MIPKLTAVIAEEKKYPEDAYAAKVCLAEIYWLREDAVEAVGALGDVEAGSTDSGSKVVPLGWLEVCDVKSRLIHVAALESAGKGDEARQLYLASAVKTPGTRTLELRRWTERLLGKACMSMRRGVSDADTASLSESLQCFDAWADFWQRAPSSNGPSATSFSYLDIPRRQVWRAYYELLSKILQDNLMYNASSTSPSDLLTTPNDDMSEQYVSARRRQRAELRRVEATYESLLLEETQFPTASQTNTEVEEWTQQVISNWTTFRSWPDSELEKGGQATVSRDVLDILYRAATKTFHSTAILRQLFAVHAALAEFELAMHAFNSFAELVTKAKARAEKSGKHELGFDSNDSVVLTAAEAVRVLCRYGDHEQGEKAMEVIKTIETWIDPKKSNVGNDANGSREDHQVGDVAPNHTDHSQLRSTTLAAAHRAIGIANAHWARLTYETDSRSRLQTEALQSLRVAQTFDEGSIETAYALALLFAETRDVWAATEVIKAAIAHSTASDDDEGDDDDELDQEEISRQRQLVPLWHLLALCLSAKDDYEQAEAMCATAFEQFGDPAVLFGDDTNRDSTESEKASSRFSRGVVDQMESFEKEGLIQVKMTQLALVELMEGAEAAVDVSHELLALYGRLFGNLELTKPISKPPPTATSAAPSKLGGTLRSLAGSIRPRSARTSMEKDTRRQTSIASGPDPRTSPGSTRQRGAANGQAIGAPISITVTNEDGVSAEKSQHHHPFPFKLRGQHGDWREYGNLKSAGSNSSLREKSSSKAPPLSNSNRNERDGDANLPLQTVNENPGARDEPSSPEQPIKPMAHNASHDTWPPPPGHKDQPPRQDIRLPTPHPATSTLPQPRESSAQDRQQRISLLVKIWLFIAGLYVRAELFEDAGGAVDEAYKLAESFEMEVGAEHSSARRFFEKGWAGGKSVDGLWGDVWAAVSGIIHLTCLSVRAIRILTTLQKGDLATARSQPFVAMPAYEQALSYFPDHPEGIIGLSNLLMDIYEEKIPAEEPRPLLSSAPSGSSSSAVPPPPPPRPPLVSKNSTTSSSKVNIQPPDPPKRTLHQDPTPAELNRLAARDRAYMLLSTLTRLGSGWDSSEAWFTLARSHELSRQVGKAKQDLWWVVELEETKPVRGWGEVAAGRFTL